MSSTIGVSSRGDDDRIHIAVLMGGSSNERPVSLSTGRQIVAALDTARYKVSAIDTRDLLGIASDVSLEAQRAKAVEAEEANLDNSPNTSAEIRQTETTGAELHTRADIVFIALHGKGGEDGTVQGLLEFLKLPYTGSGVLASALAMNKAMSKRLFAANGLPVIPDRIFTRDSVTASDFESDLLSLQAELGFPVFVKPNAEGSTFGCALVQDGPDCLVQLKAAILNGLEYDTSVIVEKYIRGIEITAGVLDTAEGLPESLPLVEIVPRAVFYDYESKYSDGGSEHIIPARLTEDQTKRAQQQALICHKLLGCSGMSRTDMIVLDDILYILEVNTIPGMTPTSLLPQAAECAGVGFSEMLERIVQSAMRRAKL